MNEFSHKINRDIFLADWFGTSFHVVSFQHEIYDSLFLCPKRPPNVSWTFRLKLGVLSDGFLALPVDIQMRNSPAPKTFLGHELLEGEENCSSF